MDLFYRFRKMIIQALPKQNSLILKRQKNIIFDNIKLPNIMKPGKNFDSANQNPKGVFLNVPDRIQRDTDSARKQSRLLLVNQLGSSPQPFFQGQGSPTRSRQRPRTRHQRNSQEIEVELPKIRFKTEFNDVSSRKNSENISYIDVDSVDQHPRHEVSHKQEQPDRNAEDKSLTESQLGSQWAGWNINNIHIIQSKENIVQPNIVDSLGPFGNIQLERSGQANQREKSERRKIINESEKKERDKRKQIVSNYLSGKASIVWLFILGPQVQQKCLESVYKIYERHIQNEYQVPICRNYQQAVKFLKIPTCLFKIVADIDSSYVLLEESELHKNIVAIYLYNSNKEAGISKCFELKQKSKKIKGMFMKLSDATRKAEQEIEDQVKFIKVENQLEQYRKKLRFPAFIILSGYDSTEITAYRMCLYGSLKLKERKERQKYLKEFRDLVELRYAENQKELKYLAEYNCIDHFQQCDEQKARQTLSFYVKETFFYALTNSILRISRDPEEFRPCTIPFSETYQAIQYFYRKSRRQDGKRTKKITAYRGAKLRNSDVKSLQVGSFIELLGFTSASLKRSEAEKFMDNDSYLFEIIIESSEVKQQEMIYDHGYVQINRFELANKAFKNEEEILFNALNVFQVIQLDLASAVRIITIKYGSLIDIMKKKPEKLSFQERGIIDNYHYCGNTFNLIEDDGDVLRLAEQHERCVEYYQTKIDEGQRNYLIFGKIANAQLINGNVEQAYQNVLKSLELLGKLPLPDEKVSKNYPKYERNKNILLLKQDFLHYDMAVDKYIEILGENWLEQAKLIKEKGLIKLKAGDYQQCRLTLEKCNQIIQCKEKQFEKRRKEVDRHYFIRSLCCFCSNSSRAQLQEEKQLQLLQIDFDEANFYSKRHEKNILCLEIQTTLKQISEQVGNKYLQTLSTSAASIHLSLILQQKDESNPELTAKRFFLQSTTLEKNEENSERIDSLIQTAIETLKATDLFHEDLGVYHKVLGTHRHAIIKRKLLLESIDKDRTKHKDETSLDRINVLQSNKTKQSQIEIKFSYEKLGHLYEKSKKAFVSSAQLIAYNKGTEHPEYLEVRNCFTELDLDFSHLNEAYETASQTSNLRIANFHSEGAKCYLLLAKISLAKGQLKKAFLNIQKAFEILRSSLLKVDNKQYNTILVNHPYYIQIGIQKAKIYNRQLKHDLAIKQLKIIEKIALLKIKKKNLNKTALSSIYQIQAEVLFFMGQTQAFEELLEQAIAIRSQTIGKYNIPNAICYSNLYKFLKILDDQEQAMQYHFNATEIFSRFPSDHPNAWIIHLSNGLLYFQKKQYEQSINKIEYCLKIASKRYSSSHINLLKINYQYGKILANMQEYDKALRIYHKLEDMLQEGLFRSSAGQKFQNFIDDEKLTLRSSLLTELKNIYSKLESSSEGKTIEALRRCEEKMKEYEYLTNTSSEHARSLAYMI